MRRHQQKQLLELIGTLREANAEIARVIRRGGSAAVGLLADCQDSALRIGAFIERMEGEGTETVALLARYIELLSHCHGALGSSSAAGFVPMLAEALQQIESSIKTKLAPNRIEVVFLPYKAAMWDSMETVWLAARADPRCDAYVVPIPYFDRLPTGELAAMHWEGSQYPEDVPITDYRKYNTEERRPDIIVIHTPYDNGNHVTTVHPDYYSQRLREHTDLLVYIPYFVAEDVPEHFCTCAGVLNAHRVFVQSLSARDIYIHALWQFERANRCAGAFGDAEQKIVALGSPKFDRVFLTRREDVYLPEGWRQRIFRADGTRRKVLFYNTTIDRLLNGDEKVLQKLRHVFSLLRSRDDVVLLWRPHPLNEATYRAMRPKLLEEYLAIVEQYRADGWGIYDDTADLHRAIVLSDGYFGDGGSAMQLFACTGRPVMYQNVGLVSENRTVRDTARECFVDEAGYRWFPAYHYNTLLRTNLATGETESVGSFPNGPETAWRMYRSVAVCQDRLYFAPYGAKGIAVYNRLSGQFSQIALPAPGGMQPVRFDPVAKFNFVVCHGRSVWFFPATYPAVVRYDTDTGETACDMEIIKRLGSLAKGSSSEYFRAACVRGDQVFLACGVANVIVSCNMSNGVWQVHEPGLGEYGFSGICFDGCDFWLAPAAFGPIVRWNPDTGLACEYAGYPEGYRHSADGCCGMLYAGGFVWLLPRSGNMALRIDPKSGVMEKAEAFQSVCELAAGEDDFRPDNFLMCAAVGSVIVSHTGKTNRMLEYNVETGQVREETLPIPKPAQSAYAVALARGFLRDVADSNKWYDPFFPENFYIGLEEFLDHIAGPETPNAAALKVRQIELMRQANEHMDGTCGQAIYDYCAGEAFGSPGEGKR